MPIYVKKNSAPLLKQQWHELAGVGASWHDIKTHSGTETLFCTDSQLTSLGLAKAGTLKLDFRAKKRWNPTFFHTKPLDTCIEI